MFHFRGVTVLGWRKQGVRPGQVPRGASGRQGRQERRGRSGEGGGRRPGQGRASARSPSAGAVRAAWVPGPAEPLPSHGTRSRLSTRRT